MITITIEERMMKEYRSDWAWRGERERERDWVKRGGMREMVAMAYLLLSILINTP